MIIVANAAPTMTRKAILKPRLDSLLKALLVFGGSRRIPSLPPLEAAAATVSLVLLDMICLTGFFFFVGYYYLLSTYCCALRYCSAD